MFNTTLMECRDRNIVGEPKEELKCPLRTPHASALGLALLRLYASPILSYTFYLFYTSAHLVFT